MRAVRVFLLKEHPWCSFGCRYHDEELTSLLNGFNFRSVSELWPAEVSELINVMGLIYVLLLVVGAKRGVRQRMLREELLEGSLHSVVVIELLEPVKVR
jgi:hypothetical protein